jgi:hypothetical protein
MHTSDATEDNYHVIRDRTVNTPQAGKVKASALGGVPPCQEKISYAAALPGVSLSEEKQPMERSSFVGFHDVCSLRSS